MHATPGEVDAAFGWRERTCAQGTAFTTQGGPRGGAGRNPAEALQAAAKRSRAGAAKRPEGSPGRWCGEDPCFTPRVRCAETQDGESGLSARIPRRLECGRRYGIGGNVGEELRYMNAFRTFVSAWLSFMK